LLWGNWFPCFFYLPIIALGIVIVPVLCAIKNFLACNNDNGEKDERRGKAKKVKKKEKTNKQGKKPKQTNKKVSKI
jgi:hypothetical protein